MSEKMIHPKQSFAQATHNSIERISVNYLTPELFYNEFQRQNKPVILTDAFNDAIPVDIDKLMSLVGDMVIPVRVYGPERFTTPKAQWKSYCEIRHMTVSEYCD